MDTGILGYRDTGSIHDIRLHEYKAIGIQECRDTRITGIHADLGIQGYREYKDIGIQGYKDL